MSNVSTMDCTTTVKLTRVNYFNRQLLTADDMTTERDYFLQKLRRHNRFLHGWGVVCGLDVTVAPTEGANWRVQVGSGYALGPYGDEIFVGEAAYFDLAKCLSGSGTGSPCEPNLLSADQTRLSQTAYLCIKYAECLARPVQVAASGCGCDSDPCQYSRIVDSFQLQCMATPPAEPLALNTSICEMNNGAIAACPPCPSNPWVLLAKIKLPFSSKMKIVNDDIDTKVRRVLASTAVLQEQVIACCCHKLETPIATAVPAVRLKSISVRTSAIAGEKSDSNSDGGISLSTPPKAAGEWKTTPPSYSLDSTSPSFDFELTLTGDAPAGGFKGKVTAVASDKGSVHLAADTFEVAEKQSVSPFCLNNTGQAENETTTTITLTATSDDDPTDKVTATLTLTGAQNIQ